MDPRCGGGAMWRWGWVDCPTVRPPAYLAGVAQLVERQPSKLNVAGSSPVARLSVERVARVAQSVERILGKDEVTGSIPVASLETSDSLCPATRSFSSAPSAGAGTFSRTRTGESTRSESNTGSTALGVISIGCTRSRSDI